MQKIILNLILCCLFLITSAWSIAVADTGRDSLGLNGCTISDLATNPDGSLVLASCYGPHGLYASGDFGDNWLAAEGGSYTSGKVFAAALSSSQAFMLTGTLPQIMISPTNQAPTTFSWTPLTTSAQIATQAGLKAIGGVVLYAVTENSSPKIVALEASTGTQLASTALPVTDYKVLNFDANENTIFVILEHTSSTNERLFYKGNLNNISGSVTSWSDITATVNAGRSGNLTNGIPSNVQVGSGSIVFVRITNAGTAQFLRSPDNGASFSTVLPVGLDGYFNNVMSSIQDYRFQSKGCAKDNRVIIDNFISLDSGATWAKFMATIQETFNLFNSDRCLFDPSDDSSNRALIRSINGVKRTENAGAGSALTQVDVNQGIQGIIVQGASRALDNADNVALVTNAGVAITSSFTKADRKWLFPICNAFKTCWGDAIEIDRNDPSVLYSGTESIDKGVISTDENGDPQVSWSRLTTNPKDNGWAEIKFITSTAFPGEVFNIFEAVFAPGATGIWQKGGGVYVYDNTSGALKRSGLIDEPVWDLLVINANSIYATVDYNPKSIPETTDTRGVYWSNDGGATWTRISTAQVDLLAYDKARDILYASTASGGPAVAQGVFRMETASTGGASLTAVNTSMGRFNAFVVDQTTGDLYGSQLTTVFKSSDQGVSWASYFIGLNDETFYVLDPVEEAVAGTSTINTKAETPSSIIGGSTIGINKLQGITRSSCSLKLTVPNCSSKISKGAQCTFSTVVKSLGKKPLKNTSVSLQKSTDGLLWQKVSSKKTSTDGKVSMVSKISKTSRYRISLLNSKYECQSGVKKFTVKKGKER